MLKVDVRKIINDNSDNIERIGRDIIFTLRNAYQENDMNNFVACAYTAYVMKKEGFSSLNETEKYFKKNLPVDLYMYLIERTAGAEEQLIAISEKFEEESLLAAILFFNPDYYYGRRLGIVDTPASISQLACKLLNLDKNSVADFCSGSGNFLLTAMMCDEKSSYYGIEIQTDPKEVSELRLSLVSDDIEIKQGTVFEIDSKRKFEKIFCEHPFGVRTEFLDLNKDIVKEIEEILPRATETNKAEWCFIANVIKHLKKGGKGVVITNNGTTWNGGISTDIRKNLVEKGYLEAVITLPANLYTSISIPVSVLVLSENNKSVRMIDASQMAVIGRRQNTLSDEAIDSIVRLMKKDAANSKKVSIKEIAEVDYAINPSRFIGEEVLVENGVQFSSIIKKITRGSQIKASDLDAISSTTPTDYQYLMLANIQDGMISESLPYLSTLDKKLEKYCIKDKSIVISKVGVPVKVAVADVPEDKKILANGNLYVIEIDEEKANPIFVKAFLESAVGSRELDKITVGAVLPNIPIDSLKKIMIPLPSKEEQDLIAEKYLEKEDEVKILKLRLNKAIAELKNMFGGE